MSFASIFKTILGRTDRDRRPAPRRDGAVSGNARKTVLAALTLVVGLPTVGEAQQAPELPKTPARDRQSVVNPFPRGTGSAQNRGRAENDWYWGMLDANRARGILPTSRVPNDAATPRTLELDGWSSDPSLRGDQRRGFLGGVFRSRPTLSVPVLAGDSNSTGTIVPTTGNAIWVLATGPSSQLLTGTYFRAAARPRPNVAPNGYNRENKFYWNLGSAAIPNTGTVLAPSPAAPGVNIASNTPFQQVRLSIRVRLPQPAPSTASPAENRISDARYVVFYYKRINNTNNPLLDFEARSAVFFVSQTGGGEETLVDAAGNPVFIPFFTSASNMAALPIQPGVGAAFQGVVLDDTTNNSGTDLYVIAEALRLAQNIDAVYGTPIVTAPHGGRLTGRYDQPNGPSVPYNGLHFRQQATNPGEQPLQPRTGPNYTTPYAFTGVSATELYNGSFDFANNPRDPKYTGIAFNAFFGPRDTSLTFEPWNPTTLFRGPESLIDPRFNGQRVSPGLGDRPQVPVRNPFTNQPIVLQNGQPVTRPAAPIDADNHDVYRTNLANASNLTTNPPVPFMSHFQVISARTEYVLDPRDEAGIGTIPVGKVYANDGATGAPIWQFPDRTYAPSNVRNRLVAVRDPVTGVTGNAAPIPGIFELDKDGDGVISDDEVFIVGQGNNVSGGIFASLSYQPRVKVRGNVQLPMYDRVTEANGRRRTRIRAFRNNVAPPQPWVMDSPPGRYYSAAWMPGGANQPVEVGVVFVGAANGVLYALDAYGNNDNDYSPHPTDSRIFGEFRNGTTNILWTFGKTSLPRQNYQGSNNLETTTELYYRRLQREIPATDSFGASTPVFAYQRDGRDIDPNSYTPADPNAALDPLTEELRMFVANRNGVLYALDAAADAGVRITATGVVVGVANLPIRKDSYTVQAYFNNQVIASPRSDVRWWFRARGGIDATPAVSVLRQDAGEGTIRKRPNAPGTNKPRFGGTPQQQAEKGVFVTGLDGRLYTLDWTGPIKATPNGNGTDKPINYSDATGQLLDATLDSGRLVSNAAINLNDDYQFHNVTPATPRAIADRREGTIRPRWTFPNLYQDIDGSGNRIDEPTDTAQANTTRKTDDPNAEIAPAAVVGRTLANASTTLGPITVPPVLVDFAWKDPVVATSQYVQKSFVLVQANDAVTSGLPATESRLYLLDQVGDRVNLLTNTTVRTLGAQQRVISHPRDRWSPKVLLGDAPPAWTYRYVFDTFNTGGTTASIDMALRNNPFDASATGRRQGVPGRKTLPTVYVGGVGSVYAIDFDFHTSLFTRYRPLLRNTGTVPNPLRFTENLTPVPSVPGVDALYPGVEAVADRLAPTDPLLTVNGRGLADRRILVRSVPLVGVPSRVSSITITAGPPQNRNSDVPVPGRPAPTVPTVPLLPTNDAPIYRPDYTSPDSTLRFDATDPTRDFSRFVNQDINDPLSTTAGAFNTDPNQTLQTRNNQAFQYPMLMVTDVDGNLHAVNSNTEGEDRISDPARSYTVGWPLYGFTDQIERQFTQIHSLQFSIQGPGGPGGVAVITNAYFPSLDPAYANTARAAANPTDPFRYYPYGEPNTTNPTPSSASAAAIPTNGNDDPRPDFRPRSLSQGVAGAVGPPAVTAVPADRHTGQTGFPLDLNGLFFDKRFAGLNNAVLPGTVLNTDPINVEQTQHPNGSYLVRTRLPGYSYIGGLIDSIDPAANKNNQLPEGARADIQAGANLVDDVNPAGQGVTWIYAGGLGGLLYAYTPTVVGQGSGFVAGTPNWFFGDNVPGTPYIAIVDRATYEQIRSDAADGVLSDATPTNISNGSFARRGLKNFYEWGETVYIVVYNLIASTQPETPSDYFVTGNGSVTLVFRQGAEADTESGREQVSMLRGTNNAISAYTFNGRQVGVALYALEINGASSTRPLSPGALISVTALPQEYLRADGRRGIATQALENSVNNSDVWFAIANPLAVQAYMASTAPNAAGQLELAGLPVGVGDTQNGIGPFAAESNPVGVKSQIAPRANVTTLTPDKAGFAYSQALTQGNRLRRRVLDRYNETGTGLNPRFRQILQQAAGGDEPEFYFPVIAGTGYAEHGKAAQSSINEVQNTLRILNRSLLPTLDGVRVVADKSALWRSWPGVIPNAPANVPATSVTPAINRNNPRNTPVGMDFLGRINPLPWETAPTDTQPWNPSALNNISQDYPDIPPTANFIQAEVAGIDLVRAAGSLSAAVDAGRTVNSSVGPTAAYNGVTPVPALYA
ncbi:MAG: hypothetical protein SFU56_15230, partial [Capsulimonadales bacterium]|nr:hypothetical protein [Capsulimonadales bacterium]